MGLWALYFLGKLYLYVRGYLQLDPLWNGLFALWLIVPIPTRLSGVRGFAATRSLVNAGLAIILLWHDSWLPPLVGAVEFFREAGVPSTEYLLQFFSGAWHPWEIGAAAVILAVSMAIRRHIRLTMVVIVALMLVAINEYGRPRGDAERFLASFYAAESGRVLTWKRPSDSAPVDVVILHVCSLSWDDLDAVGMAADPFFQQFDYLLTNFNSVTSHSNPAAIRLLRAGCGQSPHDALYRPAADDCYLFDALRSRGYDTAFALNHDGAYAGFSADAQRHGHAGPEITTADLPARQVDFNGSAIHEDYAVLARWWETRQRSGSPRAALYYNTITLHDGGHWADDRQWWTRNRSDQYREFVRTSFGDFQKFFAVLESSGRNSLVVFVAEHGLALRGSKLQPPGLREVPLPRITTVPVGIKLIGPGWRRERPTSSQQMITQPTSYWGLGYLVSELVGRPSMEIGDDEAAGLAASIPRTDFVAENQTTRVVKRGAAYLANGSSLGPRWVTLDADVVPDRLRLARHTPP